MEGWIFQPWSLSLFELDGFIYARTCPSAGRKEEEDGKALYLLIYTGRCVSLYIRYLERYTLDCQPDILQPTFSISFFQYCSQLNPTCSRPIIILTLTSGDPHVGRKRRTSHFNHHHYNTLWDSSLSQMLADSIGTQLAGGDAPKLRTACENCRQSKVKCNLSGKNVCTRCLRNGLQCQYGFANRSGKPKGSKNRATLRKLGQLPEDKPAVRSYRGSRMGPSAVDREPLVTAGYPGHMTESIFDDDVGDLLVFLI